MSPHAIAVFVAIVTVLAIVVAVGVGIAVRRSKPKSNPTAPMFQRSWNMGGRALPEYKPPRFFNADANRHNDKGTSNEDSKTD